MSLIAYHRDLYQLGYVAADLDRAMEVLRKKRGVEAFSLTEPELIVKVGGEARPLQMRVAIANIGSMQLEVIQPVAGATGIYTDGIDFARSPLIFHHVGLAVRGPVANWLTMEDEVRTSGDRVALEFAYDVEEKAKVRFAYVDTRGWAGHYTEYLWWARGMSEETGNATLPEFAA